MIAVAEVRACSELAVGDQVEVRHDGRVLHRGPVLAVVPALELFWILDTRTGTRQLLDLEMVHVLKCPVSAVPDLSGPAADGRTRSHGKQSGLKRMNQVIAMVQATGRYPSATADAAWERKLAAWLRRRRRDANAGILAPAIRDGLAVLPDWRRRPGDIEREAVWQHRLEDIIHHRASGHDWPRRKKAESDTEHELGEWLHAQRFKHGRGTLSAEKVAALDAAVPGWLAGRKRGGTSGTGARKAPF